MLAQFYCALSRLKEPDNSTSIPRLRIYDGENLRTPTPKAKSIQEIVDSAGVDEGDEWSLDRFAFKILVPRSSIRRQRGWSANRVHLLYVA